MAIPLEVLYLGDEDVLPSGREHTEKFSINTETIDGVKSRAIDGGTQYTVSACSPVNVKTLPQIENQPITDYS